MSRRSHTGIRCGSLRCRTELCPLNAGGAQLGLLPEILAEHSAGPQRVTFEVVEKLPKSIVIGDFAAIPTPFCVWTTQVTRPSPQPLAVRTWRIAFGPSLLTPT